MQASLLTTVPAVSKPFVSQKSKYVVAFVESWNMIIDSIAKKNSPIIVNFPKPNNPIFFNPFFVPKGLFRGYTELV